MATKTFVAGAAVPAGVFVQMDGNGAIIESTDGTIAAGEAYKGVTESGAAAAGDPIAVVLPGGIAKMASGGVITRGTHNLLTANTAGGDGTALPAAAADIIMALAISNFTAAAGDEIEVIVLASHDRIV